MRLFFFLLLLAVTSFVGYHHYSVSYKTMQQSTVRVVSHEDGKVKGHCSGVYLGDGEILTAAHCKNQYDFYVQVKGSDRKYPAQWIDRSYSKEEFPEKDLGLLKTYDLPIEAATIDCDPLSAGSGVYAVGHPKKLLWTVTKGTVTTTVPRDESIEGNWIQMDVTIDNGNSGGPVFDRWGNVVGIVSHTMIQGKARMNFINSPHSYAVSSKMICDFL